MANVSHSFPGIAGPIPRWNGPTRELEGSITRQTPEPSLGQPTILIVLAAAFVVSTYLGAIRISSNPFAENPENVVGVLLAGAFVVLRFGRWRLWSGPAKWLLVYFAASAVVTFGRFLVERDVQDLRTYAQYAQAFLLYIIFFDLCRDGRLAKTVVATFLVTTILLSVVANLGLGGAVGGAAIDRYGMVERVGVLGMNLNYQAFLYAAAIVALLCRALARWPSFRGMDWVLAAGGASMLVALLRTGSRGGLATLVGGVAAALALMFRGRRWGAYVLLVPLLLYGMGEAIMGSEVIRERVEAALSGRDLGARDVLAREAFQMLTERPLTGWGARYVDELGVRMGRLRIAAHNTYLQVASAFGLIGFIPWFWGLWATGIRLWRHRADFWAVSMLAVFLALLLAMIPGNYAYGRFKWVFLAMAGAMPFEPRRPFAGKQVAAPATGEFRGAPVRRPVLSRNGMRGPR